ncbi:hypothetical protein BGZ67_007065 [Mortierella alpina]|nr:hypothetical protein BGZ67_007065 [Mortierella alpina]
MSTPTLTPEVLWAQRSNLVYVTINIPDTTPTINLTENKLEVSATSDGKNYAVDLEFNEPIDTENSIKHVNARNIKFTLKKTTENWWPRLNKGSKKLNFVKTDFALWKDEDDEDDEPEASEAFDMGGMGGMPGMGGMGGMPGMGGMGGMPGMGDMGGMGGMGGMDLQSLMASMGQGGQGLPNMGDEDEQEGDSDDEDDVPALEQTAEDH